MASRSAIHTADYRDLRRMLWLLFANGSMSLAELTQKMEQAGRRCRDLIDLLVQREIVVEKKKEGHVPCFSLSNSYFKPGNRVIAELFSCRMVNAREIRLYVMLMQVLARLQAPISGDRLYHLIYETYALERLEKDGEEFSGFYKERNFKDKLKAYIREGLVKETRVPGGSVMYSRGISLFDQLDDAQLAKLLLGLQMLSASFVPVTPGVMLLESLREYMGEKAGQVYDVALKASRPQAVLDEDVIWRLLQIAENGQAARITYLRRQGGKVKETIRPIEFVYDADFARWYVVGRQGESICVRRGDRIEDVQPHKIIESEPARDELSKRLEFAWCISGVDGQSPPLKVQVRFRAGGAFNLKVLRYSFLREDRKIPNRVVDEGEDYFVCEFVTLDPHELAQWLRRYGSCAEVLPVGDGVHVRQLMRQGWKELMEIYGAV